MDLRSKVRVLPGPRSATRPTWAEWRERSEKDGWGGTVGVGWRTMACSVIRNGREGLEGGEWGRMGKSPAGNGLVGPGVGDPGGAGVISFRKNPVFH